MDRFALKNRQSKYSERCALHTSDITSSHGVKAVSKLKRKLNQRSRASLRITERELREELLGSNKATKLFADMLYYQEYANNLTVWLNEHYESLDVEDWDWFAKRNERDEAQEQANYLQRELDKLSL